MTPHTDLITRLEKATGADREFDCALAVAVGGFVIDGELYGEPAYCIARDGEYLTPGSSGDMLVPKYTSSLDAVLALLRDKLPDAYETISNIGGAYYEAYIADWPSYKGRHTSAPIALLIALLWALRLEEA